MGTTKKSIPRVKSHPATRLLRAVIDENDKYTKNVGEHLLVNQTDLVAMTHLINSGPMSAGDLAKAVGVSPGAATTMIDRLVKVGHVTRESNPEDRRAIVVVPKPESVAEAWKQVLPIITASENILDSMNETERAAVEKYLGQMLKAYQGKSA